MFGPHTLHVSELVQVLCVRACMLVAKLEDNMPSVHKNGFYWPDYHRCCVYRCGYPPVATQSRTQGRIIRELLTPIVACHINSVHCGTLYFEIPSWF